MSDEKRNIQMNRSCPCWHLYVVRAEDQSLYAGISTDVQRRFQEHVAQGRQTAKYLLAHRPKFLAFSHPVGNRSLALRVEHSFKRLSKKEKEEIVNSQELIFDQKSGIIL